MTAETDAGSIVIKIIADTSKLEKGTTSAKKELQKFSQATKDARTSTNGLQEQMDLTGQAATGSSRSIDTLTQATEETADAADTAQISQEALVAALAKLVDEARQAGTQTSNAGDQIEKAGTQAENTAGKMDKMRGAARELKAALGTIGLLAVLKKTIDYLAQLEDSSRKTYQNFATMSQNIEKATTNYNTFNSATRNLVGEDETQEGNAGYYVNKYFGYDTFTKGSAGYNIGQAAINAAQTTGVDVVTILSKTAEIMDKYNRERGTETQVLTQLLQIADTMNSPDAFSDLLTASTTYDKLWYGEKGIGLSYEQMLAVFQAWGKDWKSATEESAVWQKELQDMQNQIAEAVETLPEIRGDLADAQKESEALLAERKDLIAEKEKRTAEGKDTASIVKEIAKIDETIKEYDSEIKDLKLQIQEMELTATQKPGDLLKELITDAGVLTDAELYTKLNVKDKDEFIESIENLKTIDVENLPEGVETAVLTQTSLLQDIGGWMQDISGTIKAAYFSPENIQAYRTEISSKLGNINPYVQEKTNPAATVAAYGQLLQEYEDLTKSRDYAYNETKWAELLAKVDRYLTPGDTTNNISVYIETPQLDTYAAQKTAEAIAAQQSKTKAGAY
ncbi:MAG TPA: hypothetical protein O0X39_01330 [Methanocorpusculum sp.]|nr:hypothetical protein [Methanocorpusculum sp.]